MTAAIFQRYIDALATARIEAARAVPVVVEVALVPASPAAPLAPVVEVALVPVRSMPLVNSELRDGSACSSSCGHCGRCTDGVHANCACADCGQAFWKGPEDSDSYCDGCRDRRDAHTTALELRMAKAGWPAATRTREVA